MRGKTVSIATAVLVLAFFFLPWFSVSYNGRMLGQFSGYQLAVGAGDYALDGLDGRSVLFLIPFTAVVVLFCGIITYFRPSLQKFAAVGMMAAAAFGLVILFFQVFSVSENTALILSTEMGPLVNDSKFCLFFGWCGNFCSRTFEGSRI